MAKQTSPDSSLHEMAQAEVDRQQAALRVRDDELTARLAQLYQESRKGHVSAPVLDANALAARKIAASLLNGSTPAGLVPTDASANIKLEQHLMNEREGVRIALKILNDKSIAIRAAEAVTWGEKNRTALRELSRRKIFAVLALQALDDEVDELIATCPDIGAVSLPGFAWIERRYISGKLIEEMVAEVLNAGLVTPADVKKAKQR
jgi:hypothetical protein